MQTVVIANFLLATLISFSLNYLWSMINTLQMIVYLPMYNVIFPGNISMFLSVVIGVATFDIIPMIDEINDVIFSFKYTLCPNELKALGLSSWVLTQRTSSLIQDPSQYMVFAFCYKLLF